MKSFVYMCLLPLLLKMTKAAGLTSGSTAALRPEPITDQIIKVDYSCNGTLVAKWFGNQTTCYTWLKGRCQINNETGALTINNLNLTDCCSYKVKIYTIIGKPIVNNLPLNDCGNQTTNGNATGNGNATWNGNATINVNTTGNGNATGNGNDAEGKGSATVSISFIIIIICSIVAVALLIFGFCCCYKHRRNAGHHPEEASMEMTPLNVEQQLPPGGQAPPPTCNGTSSHSVEETPSSLNPEMMDGADVSRDAVIDHVESINQSQMLESGLAGGPEPEHPWGSLVCSPHTCVGFLQLPPTVQKHAS